MKKLLPALVLIPTFLFSQSRKERKALEAQQKADQQIVSNLKIHIQKLTAADAAGSNAARAQAEYISEQFRSIGLMPKGTDGFMQQFSVDDGKRIETSTYFKVNDKLLEVNKDYFPLPFSAEKKVAGMPAMALRERGAPWFVDIKDWLNGATKIATRVEEAVKKEAVRVASKGATALLLYNSGSSGDPLVFNKQDRSDGLSIPVVYITSEGFKKYFSDQSQMLDIEVNVAFKESKITGSNVVGYLDNAAQSTIVIGAHYAATGRGKASEAGKIAEGADDNSSGAAMLIELARMLAASKAKGNNYLFIALAGSDNGATAVNYWLDNTTLAAAVNFMVNLDMLGSYNENRKLSVQGYRTSPVWNVLFASVPDKKIEIAIDSIGEVAEPSASFYNRGIPVLSFSAASHMDYFNRTDSEVQVNYAGELQIAKFIIKLIEASDSKGKVSFAKIDQQPGVVASSSLSGTAKTNVANDSPIAAAKPAVSLGIIPDKTVSEDGLRITGVSPKKLAAKLGLQAGDVLTGLGSHRISDFKSYVLALANFKAGDKTTLRIKRGKDDREFAVEF